MTIDRTHEALDRLLYYMEQPKQSNIDLSVLSPNQSTGASTKTKSDIISVLFKIMDVSDGGLSAKQIAKLLNDFATNDGSAKSEIDKFISLYVDGNTLQPNNLIAPIIKQDKMKLSIIQVDTIRITPAGRDVGAVCALLTMIPTIELSRCVPYLTIDVQTGRPPISGDNRVQGLTINKFLGGAYDVSTSQNEKLLVMALQGQASMTDGTDTKTAVDTTVSGMELFTSPQTLNNPDPTIDALRAGVALDKFKPFMSIERFSVELTPQVGFFAYRTADLDITLHDRSRLSEIADFIRADLYGTTELSIEYGWSHPDTSGDNIYADLLNSMRAKEKYGIVNSQFSMTKNGEVKIKLKLFTRGMSDFQTVRIGDQKSAVDAIRAVRNLQKSIAAIRAKLSQSNDSGNKEIRGEQHLFSNSEDIGSALVLSDQSRSVLMKFIDNAAKSSNGDIKDLAKALTDLYGKNGKGSQAVADLNKSVASTISAKLNGFKKATKKDDPFLFSAKEKLNKVKDIKIDTDRTGYVSLGRLLATFVGLPIATQGEEKYDDVQLIFYPFNAKAGACSNHNIAEFIIKINELEKGLEAIARSRGLQLSLRDFMQYISNNFIDDVANPAYGLSNFYSTEIDPKTGVRTQPSGRPKNLEATKLYDHVQARLLQIGSQDGVFKPPQIDLIIETVPAVAIDSGQLQSAEKLRTILKIHVFDKCATAYEGISSLILASREEDLRTIGNVANNVASEHARVFNETIKRANTAGVVVSATDVKAKLEKVNASISEPGNVYNITFDIDKLRAFIRQNVPTLTYGSNNTGIKDATFSTIQNPNLSTIHMLRAGDAGPLAPSGLTKSNLPLRTLPAKVSMTTVGCPLFSYAQQMFLDFMTNTTIDNIYGINKLTHEISPGRFESKIDFVPLDAYGRYESLPNQVGTMLQQLDDLQNKTKK